MFNFSNKGDMQKLRIFSQLFLVFLLISHIFLWYIIGWQEIGSIGIEALFWGLTRGIINAGTVFWIIIFLSAILFGRFFCGWFCWFGAYQEAIDWGYGRFKVEIPQRAPLYVAVIAFIGLVLKIYYATIVHWLETFPNSLAYQASTPEPWGGQQTGISILITLILYGPILIYIFGERAWCRYLCPIGMLLKILSFVSLGKIRLINDECVGCGTCNRNCDMQVDVMGELKEYGEIRSLNCIRCFKCTDACPNDAIAFRMTRTEATISEEKVINRIDKNSLKIRQRSTFDIAIASIWVSFVVIFTVVGLRQNAPMEVKVTMTAGSLIIIYGLVWKLQQIWTNYKKETPAVKTNNQ